jgi:hypothetical protein
MAVYFRQSIMNRPAGQIATNGLGVESVQILFVFQNDDEQRLFNWNLFCLDEMEFNWSVEEKG